MRKRHQLARYCHGWCRYGKIKRVIWIQKRYKRKLNSRARAVLSAAQQQLERSRNPTMEIRQTKKQTVRNCDKFSKLTWRNKFVMQRMASRNKPFDVNVIYPELGWPTVDPRAWYVYVLLYRRCMNVLTDPNQVLCMRIPSSHCHAMKWRWKTCEPLRCWHACRGYIGFTEECVRQTWMQRSIGPLSLLLNYKPEYYDIVDDLTLFAKPRA
jgi:hypothetical protein